VSARLLGVVTGLKSEARVLRGLDVACISIGGKADGAAAKIERLIAGGVTGLVSFGIAGALHPELRCGDVVVAERIADEKGDVFVAHPAWVPAAAATPRSVTPGLTRGPSQEQAQTSTWIPAQGRDDEGAGGGGGAILGLDRMLASPQEKAAAFARTGALAIDMESHHAARAAAAQGLPFIAIRAISDRADEALPSCFADFVDGAGATKMSAVLAALISGRVSLRELFAAGRSSRLAHQALFGCRGAVAGLR
jgi:nucleoside phosphorylase